MQSLARLASRRPALASLVTRRWNSSGNSAENVFVPPHQPPQQAPSLPQQTSPFSDPYIGISSQPFDASVATILNSPLDPNDVEMKPDGIVYLPEIKYRRILGRAFGPGGWAMMPIGNYIQESDNIYQSYHLYCMGRFVAQAWGEQSYDERTRSIKSLSTALEGAKSNAIMRCCKDLGIASELWDPEFLISWKSRYAVEAWCEDTRTKNKKKLWRRRDRPAFEYPYKEISANAPSPSNTRPIIQDSIEATADFSDADVVEVATRSAAVEEEARTSAAAPSKNNYPSKSESSLADPTLDGIVPDRFKKISGMTWRQVLTNPQHRKYVQWVVSAYGGRAREVAQKALELRTD